MVERTFQRSYPLAYTVNKLDDFNMDVINAFRDSDQQKIKQLTSEDTRHYDLFICVNSSWHAFILCIGVGNPTQDILMPPSLAFHEGNPFEVSDALLCPTFELCFNHAHERMYKIKFEAKLFGEIKKRMKKSYYIARYAGVNMKGLQFAALRAAPHCYRILLDDCVEFSKTFCAELLAYSDNYGDIEEQVNENIRKASASGFSVEQLSRRVRSSGWIGNTFLGGMDVSQLVSGNYAALAVLVVVGLVYPVIVAFAVVAYWGRN